jgi:uncharacterized protein YdhG (YjbR/CyaY superfamily)
VADPANVDEYIAQFPADVAGKLAEIREAIRQAAPEATERISYGTPAFYQGSRLIWFGAYRRHFGLYPRTREMEAAIEGLSACEGTKGSIYLPLEQPIPSGLITEIVRFRLAQKKGG